MATHCPIYLDIAIAVQIAHGAGHFSDVISLDFEFFVVVIGQSIEIPRGVPARRGQGASSWCWYSCRRPSPPAAAAAAAAAYAGHAHHRREHVLGCEREGDADSKMETRY